jgi:hypothetical protein
MHSSIGWSGHPTTHQFFGSASPDRRRYPWPAAGLCSPPITLGASAHDPPASRDGRQVVTASSVAPRWSPVEQCVGGGPLNVREAPEIAVVTDDLAAILHSQRG